MSSMRQLRILVGAAQVCGLLPFTVHYLPMRARPSARATFYSSVFAGCLYALLASSLVHFLCAKSAFYTTQSSLMITTGIAWLLGVMRMFCIYFVHVWRRNEIGRLFNEAVRIRGAFLMAYGTQHISVLLIYYSNMIENQGKCS